MNIAGAGGGSRIPGISSDLRGPGPIPSTGSLARFVSFLIGIDTLLASGAPQHPS